MARWANFNASSCLRYNPQLLVHLAQDDALVEEAPCQGHVVLESFLFQGYGLVDVLQSVAVESALVVVAGPPVESEGFELELGEVVSLHAIEHAIGLCESREYFFEIA